MQSMKINNVLVALDVDFFISIFQGTFRPSVYALVRLELFLNKLPVHVFFI